MAEPHKAAKARASANSETAEGEGRRSSEKEVGPWGWSSGAKDGTHGGGGEGVWSGATQETVHEASRLITVSSRR
jgi:hypothetical protein